MQEISDLLSEREKILDSNDQDPQAEIHEKKILTLIFERKDDLPVDYIIESLTRMGYSPNILYDDNGHFAVSFSGMQNVPSGDEPESIEMMMLVEKPYWKDTIRDAVYYYLDEIKGMQEE